MAVVRLKPKGLTPAGSQRYEAEFIRVGGAPRGPQFAASELLVPKKGERGFIPRGTENRTG
jgi:hypothetical protein